MTDHFMTLGANVGSHDIVVSIGRSYEIIDREVEDIEDTLTIEMLVKKIDDFSPKKYRCRR